MPKKFWVEEVNRLPSENYPTAKPTKQWEVEEVQHDEIPDVEPDKRQVVKCTVAEIVSPLKSEAPSAVPRTWVVQEEIVKSPRSKQDVKYWRVKQIPSMPIYSQVPNFS